MKLDAGHNCALRAVILYLDEKKLDPVRCIGCTTIVNY